MLWRKKTPLLTPVEARLQLISELKREIKHFKREVDHIEVRLGEAEAEVRELTRRKSSEPQISGWCDNRISAEQNIILGFHSRIAEYRAEIVQRQRRIVNLYDEIDSLNRFGVGPDREEAPARA